MFVGDIFQEGWIGWIFIISLLLVSIYIYICFVFLLEFTCEAACATHASVATDVPK
jgi:hypothetical protein